MSKLFDRPREGKPAFGTFALTRGSVMVYFENVLGLARKKMGS